MPRPGRFVTIEGAEGAGKSTQARLLADALAAAGLTVRTTREPGGSPGAERLRGLLLSGDLEWSLPAEVLLHFAARADHVDKTIRPALAAGQWVVCDRFSDSTMVYQGYGLGANRETIAALTAMLGLAPDLTLVLDVSVETSLARLTARGVPPDRYERLGRPFFERIRAGFRAVFEAAPQRCMLIDAEGDPAAVAARLRAVVAERLGVAL